jgi:uncharacterized protein YfaS (alpha-2-macroglobulin family)
MSAEATAKLLQRLEPLPDLSARNAQAPVVRAPSAAPSAPTPPQPIAFARATGKPAEGTPLSPAGDMVLAKALIPPTISPSGEVAKDSEVRIRFDEAMVPVAKLGKVAHPPAAIVPKIEGSWRWLDARVLVFTAATSFPGSTEFKVTVPAGTKALSGAVLGTEASARFSTAPVRMDRSSPHSNLLTGEPLLITFDQAIDPERIALLLRVKNEKNAALAWKIMDLPQARKIWERNPKHRTDAEDLSSALQKPHIILAPEKGWPSDSYIGVVLDRGAPSKDGPRVTTAAQSLSLRVAPVFTVHGMDCDFPRIARRHGALCPVGQEVRLGFSNAIDPASFTVEKVQIEGEPVVHDKVEGTGIWVKVPDKLGRKYAVTIGEGLYDEYGQALTGDKQVSFTTGPRRHQSFIEAQEGLHVLDTGFEIPQWIVVAQAVPSVRIQLYRVEPKDYFAYEAFESKRRPTPPGRQVFDKEYVVGAKHGMDIRLDLRPALNAQGHGHVIAIVSTPMDPKRCESEGCRDRVAWIQVSKLAVSARVDQERVNAWVHDLTPSKLLASVTNAEVSLLIAKRPGLKATTRVDGEGHAAVDFPPAGKASEQSERTSALLLARTPDDSTFTALHRSEAAVREENALWYVSDDRFLYKPGETVYVKGWLRWTHNGVNPDLRMPAAGEEIAYSLSDARGIKVATGTAKTTELGGFDLQVQLPGNVNLGKARFQFTVHDSRHSHPISIQEFRAPAFAVSLNDDVTHAGVAPLLLGETIEMSASARYYAGGGLAGASVRWQGTLSPASYDPPGWPLFYFGGSSYWPEESTRKDDVLDGNSAAGVSLAIAALPNPEPAILKVDATITDLDRMSIRASSRAILVHPSAYYVGSHRKIVGNEDLIELIVTDVDGHAVAGVPIDLKLEGFRRADNKLIDTQTFRRTSGTVPVTCPFKPVDEEMIYRTTASVRDQRGRENRTYARLYWGFLEQSPSSLQVVPDKHRYTPGEIARIEIRSDVFPAPAVVSFSRAGVIRQRHIELLGKSTWVELPVEPGFMLNLHVQVDRYAARDKQGKPHPPLPGVTSAEGEVRVDPMGCLLTMQTRAIEPLIEPGQDATFEVTVEHDGKPKANAEVALMVVDEAILALAGKSHAPPLQPFFFRVEDGTDHVTSIWEINDVGDDLVGDPGVKRYSLKEAERFFGSGTGGGGTGEGSLGMAALGRSMGRTTVQARKDFRANAVFSPALKTDTQGRVKLTVKMPDSLTRFRIVALASAGTYLFGKAEGTIVTQRKLNARTIAPRFLTQGDRFSLPVLVQNLDTRPRTVDVAVRAANLAGLGPAGKQVTVPGGQRAEVRFDFATQGRGQVVVQTIAASGDFADASNVEFPVYEPATTESFATYGVVDEGTRFERLEVPADVFPQVGGVQVSLASSELQSLTDAFWYLHAYPFECAEQRSSRMLATAAIFDILEAFQTPERPSRAEIEKTRKNDVRVLIEDQLPDGGWGYFRRMKSDPFVTMQVMQAMAAQSKTSATLDKAKAYVRQHLRTLMADLAKGVSRSAALRPKPEEVSATVSLAASALTALAATGEPLRTGPETLDKLATQLGAYPLDAKARLLSLVAKQTRYQAMRARLLGDIIKATHETASTATVTTSYTEAERLLLVSNSKTNAVVLDALLREAPDHALVLKLARGLLSQRRHGRWGNTQDNLVALQSLRRFFNTFEKQSPDYTARLWVGDAAYAEHAFAGRTNTQGQVSLDWSKLVPGSTHEIALLKQGQGRLYYRVGIDYAPKEPRMPALDAGFVVRRAYSALGDAKDVQRLPDGRWRIRLGAKVLVSVEAVNTTIRHNVALVDPLPAGFETVNAALATSEKVEHGKGETRWDFTNLRDNRSEAFALSLAEGQHRMAYAVRATTPGVFIAAPAKAEEMYSPETFGRSAGEVVEVVETH